MIKLVSYLLGLLVSSSAVATDQWLCTQEASQIQDGALLACDVGEGKNENDARVSAFEHARDEFIRICSISSGCQGNAVTVEPNRTSCEKQSPKGYKCYRLLTFTIDAFKKQNKDTPTVAASESIKKVKASSKGIDKIVLKEKNEIFVPFIYESIASNPKVRIGMSKKDLLSEFGAPVEVDNDGFYGTQTFRFAGEMCMDKGFCYVDLKRSKVIEHRNFQPIYTEDLKDKSQRTKVSNR